MGAGKTVVALSAIHELVRDEPDWRFLVLAPLKVCNEVWSGEAQQWEHLQGLHVVVATGDAKQRRAAVLRGAEVTVVNFENLPWLVDSGLLDQFDGLLVDEVTKLKGGGVGFKKLRKHLKDFKWRVAMSGTPVSENWQHIFYQMMVADKGAAFGRNKKRFLREYFYPTDFRQRSWAILPGSGERLAARVAGVVHTVPPYQHTLPPLTVTALPVSLTPAAAIMYKDMAGTMEAGGVLAENAAVKTAKLQQIANGFIYREEDTLEIHHEKLGKLSSKILENGRRNFIVVYQHKWELAQLLALYPDAGLLGGGVSAADTGRTISEWNTGRLNVLLLHPKSAGHGLNLASGGSDLIWFAPPWSRDLFDQTNARIWRRGQTQPVQVWVLTAVGTVDELITARLDDKAGYMPALLDHLSALRG